MGYVAYIQRVVRCATDTCDALCLCVGCNVPYVVHMTCESCLTYRMQGKFVE